MVWERNPDASGASVAVERRSVRFKQRLGKGETSRSFQDVGSFSRPVSPGVCNHTCLSEAVGDSLRLSGGTVGLEGSYMKDSAFEGHLPDPKAFTLLGSQRVSGGVKDTALGSYEGELSLCLASPSPNQSISRWLAAKGR